MTDDFPEFGLIVVSPIVQATLVSVNPEPPQGDFALQMRELVDVHFPGAEMIKLVVDNLSTHTPAALYETFAPSEARRITRKLEFHYTPKHGSWLNMAECEFAVLAQQCLDRRLPDIETLCREISAWQARRNLNKAMINWCFSTTDARVKLKQLYPSISDRERLPETNLIRAA